MCSGASRSQLLHELLLMLHHRVTEPSEPQTQRDLRETLKWFVLLWLTGEWVMPSLPKNMASFALLDCRTSMVVAWLGFKLTISQTQFNFFFLNLWTASYFHAADFFSHKVSQLFLIISQLPIDITQLLLLKFPFPITNHKEQTRNEAWAVLACLWLLVWGG